jgi:hypothetical protein
MMRSADNFNPDWGNLAPAPSFIRTARIVLVATAIGATAGAGVMLSLVDQPAAEGDKTSVAAHAIVTSVQAATPSTMPLTSAASAAIAPINAPKTAPKTAPMTEPANVPPPAQAQLPAQVVPQMPVQMSVKPPAAIASQSTAIASPQPTAASAAPANSGAGEASTASAPPSAPGIAVMSDSPPATEVAPGDVPDQTMVTPDGVPPQKKTKHAGPNAASGNDWPTRGLGTALRRLFRAPAGTSYYPSRGF